MRNKNKIATYNKPACEASKTNLKLSVQFKRSFFIITCISFTRIFWRKLIVQKKKHSCLITKTFPRILGKESEIPSGGILIWNRRLFVVWIQFTRSICLQHTEEPFLFHFQIFAQVAFLSEILIDYRFAVSLKSYLFSLCGSLKSKCQFKSELKISWGGNWLVVN